MEQIDCRGLSCPLPVVETRNRIKGTKTGDIFEVLVDTGTSRDNVSRMAKKEGCDVGIEETENEEFILTITKK
jgi:TusA-related sulfurtransferase